MPKRIPTEVRRDACQRLLRGESVSQISEQLHVSPATLHRWKRQALIDLDLIRAVGHV